MKVLFRSIQLFFWSYFSIALAHAGLPPQGFYENSTNAPHIALIDSAQKMIDIEIYQMDNPLFQKAILNAQNAGVKIRILQEPTPVGDPCKLFDDAQLAVAQDCARLKAFRRKVIANGGVYEPFNKDLCGNATSSCLEHGKMVIVDAKVALLSTGNFNSTNLCDKAQRPRNCDRDYTYITHYGPAIQILGSIFERDLEGKPYDLQSTLSRSGAAALTVSPYSLAPLIGFLHSAKKSITIEEQYLKDPKMNAAILEAARSGIDVKIMVLSVCYFGKPSLSDAAKWEATYSAFENAGVKIRAFTHQILVGGYPGYLHAKAIVVDGTEAWVGSENGSTQSLGSNREYGIFFDNSGDVNALSSFMNDDIRNPSGESWRDSLNCVKDFN